MNYSFLIYPVLSIISFLMIFLFPAGGLLFFFISFITLLWYGEHFERSKITDFAAVIIVCVAAILDPIKCVYFIPLIVIPVLILLFSRKRSLPTYIPVILSPLPLSLLLASLVIFSPEFRNLIDKQMVEYINALSAEIPDATARLGDNGMATYLLADRAKSIKIFTYMIPCLVYVMLSIFVYIADKAKPIFDKDMKVILRDYRLPDFFVWILIGVGFLMLFPNAYIKYVSYNLLIVFGALYFLQGVQLFGIWFDKIKFPRFFRMFAYVFIAIEPPIMLLVSFFGLFSIWFRPKRFVREESSAEGENKGDDGT